jgi:uncharacterized protein (DUF2252 family)
MAGGTKAPGTRAAKATPARSSTNGTSTRTASTSTRSSTSTTSAKTAAAKATPAKAVPAKATPAKASPARASTRTALVTAAPVTEVVVKAAPARASTGRAAPARAAAPKTASRRPAAANAAAGRAAARSPRKPAVAQLTHQPFTQSLEARRAMGRALRDSSPRASHATWVPAPHRPDPVDLILSSEKGRLQELLPIRHSRMLVSPFTFYRGTAIIQAADLGAAPSSGLHLWACGDCHLMNFGGFATPERKMVFDINDFDEVSVAPFEWDIKRLTASFVLAARYRGFDATVAREAARTAAQSYRTKMAEYSTEKVLDTWYDAIDLMELINSGTDREMKRLNQRTVEQARARTQQNLDVAKMAVVQGEKPYIKDAPPLVFHMAEFAGEEFHRIAVQAVKDYRASLPPERQPLLDRYEFKDAALKVVGVGSVGTFCGIMLLMSGNGDALFLQFKQANASVLEAYAGASPYSHHGQRVVVGQRLMQAASDIFLGWFTGTGPERRQFYVRQLRDAKVSANIEVAKPYNLVRYAAACGTALARAHARSGDPAVVSGYLGKNEVFEDAMTSYAVAYADQAERDFDAFKAAVRAGKLDIASET